MLFALVDPLASNMIFYLHVTTIYVLKLADWLAGEVITSMDADLQVRLAAGTILILKIIAAIAVH